MFFFVPLYSSSFTPPPPPLHPLPLPPTLVAGAATEAGGGEGAPEVPPLMIGGQPHLPFQLQIEYTSLDGDRCLRVITQAKPVTRDRSLAERGKWRSILISNALEEYEQ